VKSLFLSKGVEFTIVSAITIKTKNMSNSLKWIAVPMLSFSAMLVNAQKPEKVKVVQVQNEKKVDIIIGDKLFTSFLYPDSLEKPVLYPVSAGNGTVITRGFPINPKPYELTDHPHHLGIWFSFGNVNGLDFWNNSREIPEAEKKNYGWIKTEGVLEASDGKTGTLAYRANWTNQANDVLLEELTRFEFIGTGSERTIDRKTTLTAVTDVVFTDSKEGVYGMRLAHELQIPTVEDKKFTDDKGVVTIVKGKKDEIANGNYLTSEGKEGEGVWSTRAKWCKVYGKMGNDSVSIAIIDHPSNVNYPTYWHARGYGLFSANPLGEKIFTNGKIEKNLTLKAGESVTLRYRIVVDNNKKSSSVDRLNTLAEQFAKQ
jgi:hypothetical protein